MIRIGKSLVLVVLLGLACLVPSLAMAQAGPPLRYGLEPLPADSDAGGSYSDTETRIAIRRTVRAGADVVSGSFDWNTIETDVGVYSVFQIQRLLDESGPGTEVQIAISVVSYDGTTKLPTYLSGSALDDVSVKTAYANMLLAIYGLTGSNRIYLILLSNEVDTYLGVHPSDITPFANLVAATVTAVHSHPSWSAVDVSASVKYTAANVYQTTYAALATAVTVPTFTYYPLNPDITVPYTSAATMLDSVYADYLALYTAAAFHPFALSETGYPSSTALNSSNGLQASFASVSLTVSGLFAAETAVGGNRALKSVTFQWQTDWPAWLLDLIGFSGQLREFVGSLGYRTVTDQPKPAWPILVAGFGGAGDMYRLRFR